MHKTEHHWSGWPGAICLHCGQEDPLEIAVADGDFNVVTQEWSSEDARNKFLQASVCYTTTNQLSKCPQCKNKYKVWECKIVLPASVILPVAFDGPPRQAAINAVEEALGIPVLGCFSGWGGRLTSTEVEVIEER